MPLTADGLRVRKIWPGRGSKEGRERESIVVLPTAVCRCFGEPILKNGCMTRGSIQKPELDFNGIAFYASSFVLPAWARHSIGRGVEGRKCARKTGASVQISI